MLFWFQDSCHWYREATLFSQSTRGHHTQRTRTMLLTLWRRVYHSSHVPNLLIGSCDFSRVLWKVLVKGVVCLSGVSIFCPLHLKSELGASGEKQRKKHFTQMHTNTHMYWYKTGYHKHKKSVWLCADSRTHSQLVWIDVFHIWLWFMIALQ